MSESDDQGASDAAQPAEKPTPQTTPPPLIDNPRIGEYFERGKPGSTMETTTRTDSSGD